MGFSSQFRQTLALLSKPQKRMTLGYFLLLLFLNLLELVGVALLALSILMLIGSETSNSLVIQNFDSLTAPQAKIIFLVCTSLFLTLKNFLQYFLTKKLLEFLAKVQVEVSSTAYENIFKVGKSWVSTSANNARRSSLVEGTGAMAIEFLGYSLLTFSEGTVLFMLMIPLVIYAPIISLIFIFSVCLSVWFFSKFVSPRISHNTSVFNEYSAKARVHLDTTADLYLPMYFSGNWTSFVRKFRHQIESVSKADAHLHLLQYVPKYFFDQLIIILVLIVGISVSLNQATEFFSKNSVAVFLGLILRLLPSLTRFQSALLFVRRSMASSSRFLEMQSEIIQSLDSHAHYQQSRNLDGDFGSPTDLIVIQDVSFSYSNTREAVFENLSFKISKGEVVALTGGSGSGKTTLVNLLAGVLEPTAGLIRIHPDLRKKSSIGYMPQEIRLHPGTVAENIAIGVDSEAINLDRVMDLIDFVGLRDTVNGLPLGIHEVLDYEGEGLSGGQKQRLALARSLYDMPSLLIVDEPTSSLDETTEREVFSRILSLRAHMGVIVISHQQQIISISDRHYKL